MDSKGSAARLLLDSPRVRNRGPFGRNPKCRAAMPASAAPARDTLLEARDIDLWRGEHHLLRRVSFSLHSGELLQVTGENGSGKTSLLRVACGLLPAESGDILWRGVSIRASHDAYHPRPRLSRAPQCAEARPHRRREPQVRHRPAPRYHSYRREAVLDRTGLTRCVDSPGRVLSAGQRRRVAFARVLLSKAPLWILDEPTTNLDVGGIALIERLIKDHLEEGGSVLTAAHHGLLCRPPPCPPAGTGCMNRVMDRRAAVDAALGRRRRARAHAGCAALGPGLAQPLLLLCHRRDAVSARDQPGPGPAAADRARCGLGGGDAILPAGARVPVPARCRGRNDGTMGACRQPLAWCS